MNIRFLVLLLLVVVAALPGRAGAFDGDRKGFVLGLGAGFGAVEEHRETFGGLATTLKIGAGTTERFLIYYSNRVVFFSNRNRSYAQGMTAGGVSYFLEPVGPSFFFSGEFGIGVLTRLEGTGNRSGVGFTVGVGYEFTSHVLVEANYMRAFDAGGIHDLKNYTLAVSWLGY